MVLKQRMADVIYNLSQSIFLAICTVKLIKRKTGKPFEIRDIHPNRWMRYVEGCHRYLWLPSIINIEKQRPSETAVYTKDLITFTAI